MSNYPPQLSVYEQDLLIRWVKAQDDNTDFVEYGCGGSTLMLAEVLKPNQRLWSIEHNPTWAINIATEVSAFQNANNTTLTLLPPFDNRTMVLTTGDGKTVPLTEDLLRPYGSPMEELPMGLEKYLRGIEVVPQMDTIRLITVDGVARGATLRTIRHHLDEVDAPVMVFLHDYVGREVWYDWALYDYERIGLVKDGTGLVLTQRPTNFDFISFMNE